MPPAPRQGATLTTAAGGAGVYLFGGSTASAAATSDLFLLSPSGFPDLRPAEMTNLALGAPVQLSSSDSLTGGPAYRATDGVLSAVLNPATTPAQAALPTYNLCTNSNASETNPNVRVDLGAISTPFDAVAWYTRTDCNTLATAAAQRACEMATLDFQIWVTQSPTLPWFAGTRITVETPYVEGGSVIVATPKAAGRFVFIVLPGAGRVLSVCEFQVLRSRPWVWRQLSGTVNAARPPAYDGYDGGIVATTTSSSVYNFGAPHKATDGVLTNNFDSQSCMMTNYNNGGNYTPGATQWLLLDLGAAYDVSSVELWPVMTRLGAATPAAWLTGITLSIGLSRNAALNTACTVPASIAPVGGVGSTTIPCAATARFVIISRASTPTTPDDTLAMCEVLVWASALSNTPPARTGHAAAGFRGQLAIFGGIDANGLVLDDLRFFDMNAQAWAPRNGPLGQEPVGRAGTAFAAIGANLLFGAGGQDGSSMLADAFSVSYPKCAAVDLTGVILGSSICEFAGTACVYACDTTNYGTGLRGKAITCGLTGALTPGFSPCVYNSINAPAVDAVPGATSALVTWGGDIQPPPTHFWIRPVTDGSVDEIYYEFTDPQLSNAYVFRDPTTDVALNMLGASSADTANGYLQLTAAPASVCSPTAHSCPFVYPKNFPAQLPPADFAVETYVSFDPVSDPVGGFTAGIGIIDTSGYVGRGALAFFLGLTEAFPVYSVVWQSTSQFAKITPPFSYTATLASRAPGTGVFLRIERSPNTNGLFQAFYRTSSLFEWTSLPYLAAKGDAPNGTLLDINIRPALVVSNPLASTYVTARFNYLRVGSSECYTSGPTYVVPAGTYSVNMTGLTPNFNYQWQVQASVNGGQTWSSAGTSPWVQILYPAPSPTPTGLREVAAGRPAFQSSTYATAVAGLANDGNLGQQFLLTGGGYGCASTQVGPTGAAAGATALWWTVDLGVVTDIERIAIYGAADYNPGWLVDFTVYASDTRDWTLGGAQCPNADTPFNVSTSGNVSANFACPMSGRYVTVHIPNAAGAALVLCEVQVFASNSCPARGTSAGVVPVAGRCGAGAQWGSICELECSDPSLVPVAGVATATCGGAAWSGPDLVCAPACGALPAPPLAASCERSLLSDNFAAVDANGTSLAPTRWAPLYRRQTWGTYWYPSAAAPPSPPGAFSVNTYITGSARTGCNDEMVLVTTSDDAAAWTGSFRYSANVLALSRSGLAFRVTGFPAMSYYRFVADRHFDNFVLELVQLDVVTVLAATAYETYDITKSRWSTFVVIADGPTFTCYVDDVYAFTVVDNTLTAGTFGLYTQSQGSFSAVSLVVPCEDTGCIGGVAPGETCAYYPAPGMLVGGSLLYPHNATTQVCVNGQWSPPSPPPFTYPPPQLSPATLSIAEGSAAGSLVGAPLDATSTVTVAVINYAFVGGSNLSAITATFAISHCDGQITLLAPSLLSATAMPVYQATVRAYLDVQPSVYTEVLVTINVTPFLTKPPTAAAAQALALSENALPNAAVGVVNATGVAAAGPLTWRISLDGAAGRFAINATTGLVSVAPGNTLPIDFEATPNSWVLGVEVHPAAYPTASTTISLTISLLDANDPPVLPAGMLVWLNGDALPPPAVLAPLLSALTTDQDTLPAFRTAPRFTLLPWSSLAGGASATCGSPLPPSEFPSPQLPTADGLLNGTSLFALDVGGNGILSTATSPSTPWASAPLTTIFGVPARALYRLCISVADSAPGAPSATLQTIGAAIEANTGSSPVITAFTAPASLSTTGGDTLWFYVRATTPLNLAAAVTATYANAPVASGAATTYNASCTVANTTTFSCTTVAGVGSSHRWSFLAVQAGVGTSPIAAVVNVISSYAAPRVTTVTGNAGVPTSGGGAPIVVSGANFGPAGSPVSLSFAALGSLTTLPCTTLATNQTSISCSAAAGAGANLGGVLLVGNQAVAASSMSYAPPTVTAVRSSDPALGAAGPNEATNLASLSPNGGTPFYVVGANFGPAGTVVGVTIGATGVATGCALWPTGSLTVLRCTAPSGVGTGLRVTVTAASVAGTPSSGNVSALLGVGYSAPTVFAVSPADVGATTLGNTAGGSSIVIAGTLFGTPGITTVSVVYATANRSFTATGCSVATANTITCLTAPGSGSGFSWQVVFPGVSSNSFVSALGYDAPVVSSVTIVPATGLSTAGGTSDITLHGENFGPSPAGVAGYQPALSVTYSVGGLGAPWMTARSCTTTLAHRTIVCSSAAGVGAGLEFIVAVDGVSATLPVAKYCAPRITNITMRDGSPIPAAGLASYVAWNVTLLGACFGALPSAVALSYGPSGTETALPAASWVLQSDSTILVTLPPTSGTVAFIVSVAGQANTLASSPRLAFSPITVTSVTPNHAPCVSAPSSPTRVTLYALAPLLGSSFIVQIGSGSTWATVVPVTPTTAAALAALTPAADGSLPVPFALPPAWAGQGLAVRLVQVAANDSSIVISASLPTPATEFSYDLLTVANAVALPAAFAPGACPAGWTASTWWTCGPAASGNATTGGSSGPIRGPDGRVLYALTVTGVNFGASPAGTGPRDPAARHVLLQPATGCAGACPWSESTLAWASGITPGGKTGDVGIVTSWSDSSITVYTYASFGEVQVQLSNADWAGATRTASSAVIPYANVALGFNGIPGGAAVDGTMLYNLSTAGAGPALVFNISGLVAGDGLNISIGGVPCPLLAPLAAVASGAPILVSCALPAGQGINLPVTFTRTAPGEAPLTVTPYAASYAAPAVASYSVFQYHAAVAGAWVAYSGPTTTVKVPTNGSSLQVRGSNLGVSPVINVVSGPFSFTVAGAVDCTGTPGSVAAGTCAQFTMPAGQGAGFRFSTQGFTISVAAGNQASTPVAFTYNWPTVTGVTATGPGGAPARAIPTIGDASVTLTFHGHDFGAPLLFSNGDVDDQGLAINFYNAYGGWATNFACGAATRLDHWTASCALPPGTGAQLAVNVAGAAEPGWWGAYVPASPPFSYDAPAVAEVYAAVRVSTGANGSGVPPCSAPSAPPPQLALGAPEYSAVLASALSASGVAAVQWCRVSGGRNASSGFPALEGPTADAGTVVVVLGRNFGSNTNAPGTVIPNVFCPRLAWASRAAAAPSAPLCNGLEDFLGEGEVAASRVLLWTETAVVFTVPPGIGLKDVDLNVRGNCLTGPCTAPITALTGSTTRPAFTYAAPVIMSVSMTTLSPYRAGPGTLEAAGDTLVTLTGFNFGPQPAATSALTSTLFTTAKLGVAAAPSLPTASLRIEFAPPAAANPAVPFTGFPGPGPRCVSSAVTALGAPSPYAAAVNATATAWSNCAWGPSLVTVTQTSITFTAPYGVGANRPLSVVVVDGPQLLLSGAAASASANLTLIRSSAPQLVSYAPPVVTSAIPSLVLLGPTLAGVVTLQGYEFGTPGLDAAGDPWWSPADRRFSLAVTGADGTGNASLCVVSTSGRSPVSTLTGLSTLSCALAPGAVVGGATITLTVAGQTAAINATSGAGAAPLLTLACAPGYFGRPGETCASCDATNLGLLIAADPVAAASASFPSVACAGYHAAVPHDPTCTMTRAQLLMLSQLPPLTPPQLSAFALATSPTAAAVLGAQDVAAALGVGMLAPGGGPSTPICPTFPYPVVQPGWFNLNGTAAGACPPGTGNSSSGSLAYPGRDVCIAPCLDGMCGVDNSCVTGYASTAPHFRCASCASGYYWRMGACTACPAGVPAIIVFYVLGLLAVVAAAYTASNKGLHVVSASIGIDFFQVVAMLGTARVAWPDTMRGLLHVLSASYANVEIVAPECDDPESTFQTKFTGIVLLPVVLAAILLLVHAAAGVVRTFILGRRGAASAHGAARTASVLVSSCLVLTYYLYIYETRTLLAVFDCTTTTPSDGLTYMSSAPFEQCSAAGKMWSTLIAPSIVGLVVYVAGYPLAAAAMLLRRRELIMEDQLLRAKGVGDDRLTNPHAYDFRRRWGALYSSFTPDACFWTLVILLRKLLIPLSIVLFNRDATYQMAGCLIVLMVAYGLQVRNAPYMSNASHEAVLRSHTESSFTSPLHARIRATIAGVESRGRKRTHRNLLDGTGHIDRSALFGLLSSWLFDPNTLEAALLFAAAIVALMGMLESTVAEAVAYGSASGSYAVTDVALVVIITGIVYYALVVAVEVSALVEAQRHAAALLRKRQSKSLKGGKTDGRRGSAATATLGAMLGVADTPAKADGSSGGPVDVAINPLFTASGSGAAASAAAAAALKNNGASGDAALSAVRAYGKAAAPPLEMWRVIADAFEDMHARSAALAAEVATLRATQSRVDAVSGSPAHRGVGAGRRIEHAPTRAGESESFPAVQSPLMRAPSGGAGGSLRFAASSAAASIRGRSS